MNRTTDKRGSILYKYMRIYLYVELSKKGMMVFSPCGNLFFGDCQM